jgi:hypothetical protein
MLSGFRSLESYHTSAEFTREFYREQGARREHALILELLRAEQVRTAGSVHDAHGVLTKLIERIEGDLDE